MIIHSFIIIGLIDVMVIGELMCFAGWDGGYADIQYLGVEGAR